MTISKSAESQYAHAISEKIYTITGKKMSLRIVRAAIEAITELPPPPIEVDPWEKYRGMTGSGD